MTTDKDTAPEFSSNFWLPRYWPTWLLLGFFHLLARLPLCITLPTGSWLGSLAYYVAKRRRRYTEINIALCFPELSAIEQKRLVKNVMRSVGMALVESAVALWGSERKLKNRYSVTGLEHIDEARRQGRGVLLVGCHFTTLDVAARVLARHVKYDMLYRKDANPLLAYMLIHAREAFAGKGILRSDVRQLIKNLRQGHVVWYAPDQDFGAQHSVFAPFFGVPAATIVATARVAALGKAVVLPFSHYRNESGAEKGGYRLVIQPPLENYPVGDDVADATRINGVIEAAIRVQPDQYLWVHRRFKTRPPGQSKIYPLKRPLRADEII